MGGRNKGWTQRSNICNRTAQRAGGRADGQIVKTCAIAWPGARLGGWMDGWADHGFHLHGWAGGRREGWTDLSSVCKRMAGRTARRTDSRMKGSSCRLPFHGRTGGNNTEPTNKSRNQSGKTEIQAHVLYIHIRCSGLPSTSTRRRKTYLRNCSGI